MSTISRIVKSSTSIDASLKSTPISLSSVRAQKISKTHLYYTSEESGNPYITFRRDGQSTEQTITTFDTVVSRIEARDFAITARPPKLCKECDMRHYCDTKNWKFRSNNP